MDQDLEQEDWDRSVLVEPLTALAGGLLGGALVMTLAWRAAWRRCRPRTAPNC